MRVAIGLKAHCGWAALVAVAAQGDHIQVIDRRRVELVDEVDAAWARQPYHAAKGLAPERAREVVERGILAARQAAVREMRQLVEWSRQAGHEIVACAVLVAEPLPDWSIEQILAVHMRMHKAEGFLFPDALARAVTACGLNLVAIPEKELGKRAEKSLASPLAVLMRELVEIGKSVGPPWGKDQKNATLADMIALKESGW
jgi:hypothetical protein